MLLVQTGLFQTPTRLLRAGQRQSTWFWSTYFLRSGSSSGWSMLAGSQSFSFTAGSAHLKGVLVRLYMFVTGKAASSMFQHAYSTCKPASSMSAWYKLTFPPHCFKFCKQISSSSTSHISPILCICNNSWKKLCCSLLALSPFKMIHPLSGNRPKSASNRVENMLQAGNSMFQAGRNMLWHVSNTLMKIQCHPTCILYTVTFDWGNDAGMWNKTMLPQHLHLSMVLDRLSWMWMWWLHAWLRLDQGSCSALEIGNLQRTMQFNVRFSSNHSNNVKTVMPLHLTRSNRWFATWIIFQHASSMLQACFKHACSLFKTILFCKHLFDPNFGTQGSTYKASTTWFAFRVIY